LITVSRANVLLAYEPTDEEGLSRVAYQSFSIVEQTVREIIPDLEFGVDVRVEEGSLDIIAVIIATAGSVIKIISAYGGLSDGLQKMIAQTKRVGYAVRDRVSQRTAARVVRTRVTHGDLTKLDRLYKRVANGEMPAREAEERALRILEKAGEELTSDVRAELAELFSAVPVGPNLRKRSAVPAKIASDHKIALVDQGGQSVLLLPGEEKRRRHGVELRREPGESGITRRSYDVGDN
jgi:hypothetical protein